MVLKYIKVDSVFRKKYRNLGDSVRRADEGRAWVESAKDDERLCIVRRHLCEKIVLFLQATVLKERDIFL